VVARYQQIPISLRAWAASASLGMLVIALPGGPAFSGSPAPVAVALLLVALGLYRRSSIAWWAAVLGCLGLLPAVLVAVAAGGPARWDLIALGALVGLGTVALAAGQTRSWVRPHGAGQ
jgi:hypothetical protein